MQAAEIVTFTHYLETELAKNLCVFHLPLQNAFQHAGVFNSQKCS